MNTSQVENHFEQYRDSLNNELIAFTSFVKLYRRLKERKSDRLREMNIAPAFFQVVEFSLMSSIVMWAVKLFDETGSRGFPDLLKFIQKYRNVFTIESLKKRNSYPDNHWMLNRQEISEDLVAEDIGKIRNLSVMPAIKMRRDKVIAHFDKKYFFSKEAISADAPIEWDKVEGLVDLGKELLNRYSSGFDGQLFHVEPLNVLDIDRLLDKLNNCRKLPRQVDTSKVEKPAFLA